MCKNDSEGSQLPAGLTGDKSEIFGWLADDQKVGRKVFYSEIFDSLPKEPTARFTVYTAEVRPGEHLGWHIHNGVSMHFVIEGELVVEFQDHNEHYTKGDVFFEPIGAIHRGFNKHPTEIFRCVSILLTPPDRAEITPIKQPW